MNKIKNFIGKKISIVLIIFSLIFFISAIWGLYSKLVTIAIGFLFLFLAILIFIASLIPKIIKKPNIILFYNLLIYYFIFCIYVPVFVGISISTLIQNLLPPNDNLHYFFMLLCIAIASIFWFIKKNKVINSNIKYNCTIELAYQNIIVQIGVALLTILGVIIDIIQSNIYKDFKYLYILILLEYLIFSIRIQYLQVNDI